MFKKESLYINVLKNDNQLKIDHRKFSNNLILETNSSNFICEDDILPADIAQKLNSSQEDTDFTYISTLLLSDTTSLVPKELSSKIKDCEIAKFNLEYDIAVLKTTLFETKNFFVKTGIDFIYSAFHIMNLYVEKNICRNEFLALIYNDKAYILILNSAGIIIDNKIMDLPTYQSVKGTHFYEDDLEAQKLFNEIYYFELNTIIQNCLSDFYSNHKNTFVEKVTLLYSLKQLDSSDIEKLSTELFLKVDYLPINIDEEIFELAKDIRNQKSFISPRKKRKKRDFKYLYFIIFLIVLIAGLYKFYTLLDIEVLKEKFSTKQEDFIATNNSLLLPDHVNLNDRIEKEIKAIFNTIADGISIDRFKLNKNSLEMELFSKDEENLALMRPLLISVFENSKVESVEKGKKQDFKALVLAKDFKNFNTNYRNFDKEYLNDEMMSNERVLEQLKIFLPENAIIRYLGEQQKDFLQYNYIVNILVKEPKEFFTLIENLNSELYSININYPINMIKKENIIEIEFNLDFNQEKQEK
ncbi:hypothetical protein AFAEC_2024 [Aliarcobacter faecis]|uniref:hypothetical protein n=1 Tax=Aliarcobacter faecis TaxID=1564138 RepID=UPI00047C9CEC|nr:hypothetical protein [Aliarcobacter faecis]QKF74175.1 hypothetical protein AFAEC_2024 [Aliarcobacter faecis]